ncbi:MAG: ECF transporter S component [Oscillospiraceae bacterium]|nr:ECF transporter S component [Oscillospiraceae bacterium]
MDKMQQKTRSIITVGLMAALVFIFTYIRIEIPTPLGKTMLHLGNVMCLLTGLLFGRLKGGLAAGIGSMFFDMFDPVYLPECWITFIMKFCMAFVCGWIAHAGAKPIVGGSGEGAANGKLKGRHVAGAVCGALCYVALYMSKTYIVERLVKGYELETVLITMTTKGTVSLANALIAVAASLILSGMIRPALVRAGFAQKLGILD